MFSFLPKVYTKAVAVQNYLVELSRVAGSPCLITFEFKHLCRSGQQVSQTKQFYKTIESVNKKTGKLPKRPKLAADKPATQELATLNSINNLAVIKPNTIKPLETLRKGIYQESTVEVIARSAVASLTEGNKATISRVLESNLPTITYTDRIAILDKYFPKSAIDSRPLNSIVAPDKLPTSIADTICRNSLLVFLIQFNTPEALTVLPSTSLNTVFLEVLNTLDSSLAIGSIEMFKSTSSTRSTDLVSSCINLTISLSSKIDNTDINLQDTVIYTPFARCLVFDNTV